MEIRWFMGAEGSLWTGISKYSHVLIESLRRRGVVLDIDTIHYPSRSIGRYVSQVFLKPLRILLSKRKRINVLYTEDYAFWIPWSKLRCSPVVLICHHVPITTGDTLIERLKNIYLKASFLFIRYADAVIVPSDKTKLDLIGNYAIDESRVAVVYNCFEFELDKRSKLDVGKKLALLEKYNISGSPEKKIFLNVGTNESRKNLLSFLTAYSLVEREDLVFIQIGKVLDEEARRNEVDLACTAASEVHFLGFVDDADLTAFYQVADYYVSPSLHEGFGRSVIEAQYYGVPVLASDIDIYREIMGDSFFPVSNPEDADSWKQILNNPPVCDDVFLALAADNTDRYMVNSVVDSFEQVLGGLCEK